MAAREVQSYNNGEKAVMLGFKAATYPIRKAASKAFNSLLGQISGNDVSAPGGGKGEASRTAAIRPPARGTLSANRAEELQVRKTYSSKEKETVRHRSAALL